MAVSASVYIPGCGNVTGVVVEAGAVNVTGAVPLNWLHCVVSVPLGRPSSLALPCKVTVIGEITSCMYKVCAGPALTTGGWLAGSTVKCMIALLTNCVSSAESWKV